mmetsp:Transcript_871/g.2999  ORF Transcript_871/g.2999 Transcript_871/m.2999 type:complete len:373 (+) Transcript_871:1884-3002(+)
MGVPERRMRLRVGSEASACAVLVSLFLRRCASSQMRRPHCCPFLKSFWWMRKVSYEMISTAEGLVVNRRTILSTSSFLASATAITWIPFARRRASLIHFVLSSDSQLVTSETGQATIVWVTAGRPSMPCVIRVHRMAIDCSVLPRPMSSARMQPMPSKSRRPMQQSKRNCTPSRWCSRSQRQRKPSTLTAVAGVSGAAGAAGARAAGGARGGADSRSSSGSASSCRASSSRERRSARGPSLKWFASLSAPWSDFGSCRLRARSSARALRSVLFAVWKSLSASESILVTSRMVCSAVSSSPSPASVAARRYSSSSTIAAMRCASSCGSAGSEHARGIASGRAVRTGRGSVAGYLSSPLHRMHMSWAPVRPTTQ